MGYTHYWYTNKEGDQRAWSAALMDVAEMVRHSPVTLRDNAGEGDGPEFTDKYLGFNGDANAHCTPGNTSCRYCGGTDWMPGHDLAHETFLLYCRLADYQHPEWQSRMDDVPETFAFDFCKTARKPYDVMVVAALCRMAECGEDTIRVSSDGKPEDWEAGARLASILLGRIVHIPASIRAYATAEEN